MKKKYQEHLRHCAIIKAPINKLIPNISEIDSVANTSK